MHYSFFLLICIGITFAQETTTVDRFRRIVDLRGYRNDYERLGCEVENQFVHGNADIYIPPMMKVEYSLVRCPFAIGDGTVMVTSVDHDDDDDYGDFYTYSSHYLPHRCIVVIRNNTREILEGYSLHRLTYSNNTFVLDSHSKSVYVTSSEQNSSLYEFRSGSGELIIDNISSYRRLQVHLDALS